jgi:tight adherence protein B
MTPLVIALVVGVFVFMIFAIVGIALSRREQRIDERLEKYGGAASKKASESAAGEAASGGKAKKTSFIADRVDKAVAKKPFASGIALSLAQADLKITVGEFLIMNLLSCLVFALLAFLVGGSIFLVPLGAILGFFVPRIYVRIRKGARLKAFNDQLGDTITLMANALRAGYSLIQAMEAVSREMPPPISEEFARVVKETGLGLSHEEAMNHLLDRVRSDDLDLLVTAINVQHEVGGNLSEILDSIGFTIRERVRIQGEVRVLTAQGMMSGYVISFLPVGLLAILFLINREYIGAMFKEPCGWAMLAFMAIIMTAGFISIQKIVHIDI